MKLKAYQIISEALERDIEAGVRSAFKHTDEPTQEHIAEMVYARVMLGLTILQYFKPLFNSLFG